MVNVKEHELTNFQIFKLQVSSNFDTFTLWGLCVLMLSGGNLRGWNPQEWNSQGGGIHLLGTPVKWNSLAGDSSEVKFTYWGRQRGGTHLLGTPARCNSLAGGSNEVRIRACRKFKLLGHSPTRRLAHKFLYRYK